jgi:hypothetical protein
VSRQPEPAHANYGLTGVFIGRTLVKPKSAHLVKSASATTARLKAARAETAGDDDAITRAEQVALYYDQQRRRK